VQSARLDADALADVVRRHTARIGSEPEPESPALASEDSYRQSEYWRARGPWAIGLATESVRRIRVAGQRRGADDKQRSPKKVSRPKSDTT